jgi:pullulanase
MNNRKQLFLYLFAIFMITNACSSEESANTFTNFEDYPVYQGNDLGLTYTRKQSTFKIWAPSADMARILLYEKDLGGEPKAMHVLKKEDDGIWSYTTREEVLNLYYTFQVRIGDAWLAEVPDPYAKAVGRNGKRAQVVDLEATHPEGWESDQRPALAQPTDAIIYELHVRDLSSHPNSGIANTGKFLGLTETGTTNSNGESTGLDHIKDLGATHIHLLPSFDYRTVDETKLDEPQFNWGYDPENYNVPEGSYATDPADGAVRIREFKQMVKTLHENGLRVILDVVYNHTGATETSNFNQLVPGYYYRQDAMGGFANASACGNETASERAMMRKFIVESVLYWATEYHLDGFRFDLMGIHDMETMNAVSAALRKVDPTIIVYGEGWLAGDSPLPAEDRAVKAHTLKMDGIAAFSDDIRDAIKGHVFSHDAKGFVSGQPGLEESIKFGIVASTDHPQITYDSVNYSKAPWAKAPTQTVTYVSCHDNHTLWDRLEISCPDATVATRKAMHKLAGATVLTSQGIAFLHAGVEMARTKGGEENSYNKPDSVNQINWDRKTAFKDVYDYYKGLVALRKNHPAFRMTTTEQVQEHLRFLDLQSDNLVAYTITGQANGDSWSDILVILNGNVKARTVAVPPGP